MTPILWNEDAERRYREVFGNLATLASVRPIIRDAIQDVARHRIAVFGESAIQAVCPVDIDMLCSHIAPVFTRISERAAHENAASATCDGTASSDETTLYDPHRELAESFCATFDMTLRSCRRLDWQRSIFLVKASNGESLMFTINSVDFSVTIRLVHDEEAPIPAAALIDLLEELGES